MHAAAPAHVAAAVLPMLSVSYCWLEARHPDGEGEQLKHIVDTLEPHAEEWREFFDDMGVFLDWCSIYQKDPTLFDAHGTPEVKPEGVERDAFVEELNAGRAWYMYGGAAYENSRTGRRRSSRAGETARR